jgi:hypothetical protein
MTDEMKALEEMDPIVAVIARLTQTERILSYSRLGNVPSVPMFISQKPCFGTCSSNGGRAFGGVGGYVPSGPLVFFNMTPGFSQQYLKKLGTEINWSAARLPESSAWRRRAGTYDAIVTKTGDRRNVS